MKDELMALRNLLDEAQRKLSEIEALAGYVPYDDLPPIDWGAINARRAQIAKESKQVATASDPLEEAETLEFGSPAWKQRYERKPQDG